MSKVRFGVFGAGGIADRRTMPAMLEAVNCELTAMMDVSNHEALSRKYGVPCYDNEAELLSRRDIQAVYIASPVYLHLKQIRMAAGAGKHILCEKPLTLTSSEAEEGIRACRQAGVLLQEGYMMRFHGAHRRVAELIQAGDIGKPVYARAQLACWYPRIEGAWRQMPECGGGGALIDMASHLYNLLEMFLGMIVQVGAVVNTQVQDYPVDDSSTTLLRFDSGAHATVDAFYCIPDDSSRTRLEVYGSKGSILTEGTIGQGSGGRMEVYRERVKQGYNAIQAKDLDRRFVEEKFEPVNPYAAECEAFAQAILSGSKELALNGAVHGLHILKVVEGAYRSASTGLMIRI